MGCGSRHRGIHREVATELHPSVPLFSKPLASGLGVAEEPDNGESFGQQRCRLVAEALCDAHLAGAHTHDERLRVVREHLARSGVDPDRPYLRSASEDVYAPFQS